MVLISSLLEDLKGVCKSFPDARQGRSGNIPVEDFGLSAFSMFFVQSGSFLSYQRALEKGHGRSNCQGLFGITKIPSDNYIRDMLDGANPGLLRPAFERVEGLLQEEGLKTAFQRLNGRVLIAFDGTEYFCSQKIHCPHCLTRERSNGKIESYHSFLAATVVAPGHAKVIPLMPEFIARQDGMGKQDCERNAVKRWYLQHADRLRGLKPIYLGDDLFACQPVIEMIVKNGDDCIFTCKEGSHKALYDFIDGAPKEHHEEKTRRRSTTEILRYRWIEGVPLRDGKDALSVNWMGFEILDVKGRSRFKTAFVTTLSITKDTVAEIVSCARARWKIENENFNVLKNHGYELEHNFGHGEQFLAMMLASFNLLAFAWHSILDLLDPPWQRARAMVAKRTRFFTQIVTLTSWFIFPSWQVFLESLATFKIPKDVLQNHGSS